jgi:outer membrane protein
MTMKLFTTQFILIVIVSTVQESFSQSTFSVQYAINFPMGDTKDYIEKTSFRGMSLDYRYRIMPNVAVGIGGGWYTFYEKKDYDTYTLPGDEMSASGIQYRYINTMPLLLVGDYYFSPEEKFSPFVGLGIGITYVEANTQMGQFDFEVDTWQFNLAPEVGIRFGAGPGVWGLLSARYNNNFETSELDGQSYLTLNVGLMYGH